MSLDGSSLSQVGLLVSGLVAATALAILAGWLVRRGWRSPRGRDLRHRLKPIRPETIAVSQKDDRTDETINAHLLPLGALINHHHPTALAIRQSRVLIGRDPHQADILLSADNLDPVQAEITHQAGTFWLRDLSANGLTWVNYERVGADRTPLKAGDVLHFGNLGFRFTINPDHIVLQATVSRYEPLL